MDEFLVDFTQHVKDISYALKNHAQITQSQYHQLHNRVLFHLARGRQVDIIQVMCEEQEIAEDSLLKLCSEICNIGIWEEENSHLSVRINHISDDRIGVVERQYLTLSNDNGETAALVVPQCSIRQLFCMRRRYPECKIHVAGSYVYDQLLQSVPRKHRVENAVLGVGQIDSGFSAFGRNYIAMIISLYAICGSIFFYFPVEFAAFSVIIFLLCTIFKLFLLAASGTAKALSKRDVCIYEKDEDLPYYSILIPLYHEPKVINKLIAAINDIDYPQEKLDVHLLLEEDDIATLQSVYYESLPTYFNVIIVPDAFPKTKPKAMNYALDEVKGEYVAVYDAEDIPEPMQLRKALQRFKSLPQNYACVQASLVFYNSGESFISTLLAMEYRVWFGYLLKGLSLFSLPVPLGGTSNHFKVSILRKIGKWDAYNVTEDADLGIRLHMLGYNTAMLDSSTDEEGVTTFNAWLKQRSRWIKGFLQTFIVYVASCLTGKYTLPPAYKSASWQFKCKYIYHRVLAHLSIWLFLGFSVYSFLIFPLLCMFPLLINHNWFEWLWEMNLFGFALYHYLSIVIILIYEVRLSAMICGAIFVWPFYFILHSIAGYLAIAELVFKPFYWNKTTHAVSKMTHD